MTHYIPIYAKFIGVRERAICGEYVLPSRHADPPECERCQMLISSETKPRDVVSVAEVVERY
jgi:hypothetical protein